MLIDRFQSLIQSELSPRNGKPVEVTFHGKEESSTLAKQEGPNTPLWSSATELGDFVQEAARDTKFTIVMHENGGDPKALAVRVPTFKQRTQFLRARLKEVTQEMQSLVEIKTECDDLALTGAKRAAIGGFLGLTGYWALVYWLTFYKYG